MLELYHWQRQHRNEISHQIESDHTIDHKTSSRHSVDLGNTRVSLPTQRQEIVYDSTNLNRIHSQVKENP